MIHICPGLHQQIHDQHLFCMALKCSLERQIDSIVGPRLHQQIHHLIIWPHQHYVILLSSSRSAGAAAKPAGDL